MARNDDEDVCPQSVTVMWSAVFPLTARTLVSVSVNLEPQGGAVTPVYLDTPGEEAEPAAQVLSTQSENVNRGLLFRTDMEPLCVIGNFNNNQ